MREREGDGEAAAAEEEGGERKEGGRGELRSSLMCPCGGFLGGRVVKNPPAKERHGLDPWAGKIHWRRK